MDPSTNDYHLFKQDFVRRLEYILDNTLSEATQRFPQADMQKMRTTIIDKIHSILKKRAFLAPQIVMFLWKHLLVLGKYNPSSDEQFTDAHYINTLSMLLVITDQLDSGTNDVTTEVFRAYMYYEKNEFASILSRTMYIYSDLTKRQILFGNEFIDIHKRFQEKFGCSIEDYIFVVFAVYTMFNSKIPKYKQLTHDWFQSVEKTFENTSLKEQALSIIIPMTFTFDEARETLKDTFQNPWDYLFFMEKPIFKFIDDVVFPVSMRLLEQSFYEGLFWKIRSCFAIEDKSFQRFFGRPFEMYVQELITSSSNICPIPYQIIPEFAYGKQEVRSPDVMLRLGNKLLAIECKAQRINYTDSIINGQSESIEKDRIKMTVKPMAQLYTRVNELLNGASDEVDLSGVDEVYLVVANQGSFPVLKPLQDKTIQDWKQFSGINAKTNFYVMNIEELEMLASIIEKRRPIFRILSHKLNYPYAPFKNFLTVQHTTLKYPTILLDSRERLLKSIPQGRFTV